MKNNHTPVMLEEVKSFIPKNKKINVVDATFGGGGYSKAILDDFNVDSLIAIDRDPISKIFGDKIKEKHQNFELVNDKFSNIDKIINKNKLSKNLFDIIIFDLGISSISGR